MNIAQLHIEIVKQGCSELVLGMKVLAVTSEDIELFWSRFGESSDDFVLLNDFAVEVCQRMRFPITPLGKIDEQEVSHPVRLLGAA